MKFQVPIKKDWFPIYGSANRNSTIIFLEILWSKLRSKFYISTDIFGDDLDIEHISPLLFCKGVESEEKSGWLYCLHPMNDAQLLTPIHDLVWVPKEITSLQLEVFGLMAELDEISVDSKNLQALIVESGQGSEQFIESFVSSGLVYVNEENKLKYLTTKLEIVMLPDGRILAADNNDNRLTKWLNVNGYGKRLHIKGIHSDV